MTNDIPVWYKDPNNPEKEEEMYADAITKVLKRSTTFFPANVPNAPVQWKINGAYFCKNGREIRSSRHAGCGDVKVFQPDTEKLEEELSNPRGPETGGFFPNDRQIYQDEHDQQLRTNDVLHNIGWALGGGGSRGTWNNLNIMPEQDRNFFEAFLGPIMEIAAYYHIARWFVMVIAAILALLIADKFSGIGRILVGENVLAAFYALFFPCNYMVSSFRDMKKKLIEKKDSGVHVYNNTDFGGMWTEMAKK